jgi:hypothetical protein
LALASRAFVLSATSAFAVVVADFFALLAARAHLPKPVAEREPNRPVHKGRLIHRRERRSRRFGSDLNKPVKRVAHVQHQRSFLVPELFLTRKAVVIPTRLLELQAYPARVGIAVELKRIVFGQFVADVGTAPPTPNRRYFVAMLR